MADSNANQKLRKKNFNKFNDKYKNVTKRLNDEKEKQQRKAVHELNKLKRKEKAGLDLKKLYEEMESESDEASAEIPTTSKVAPSKKKSFDKKKDVSRFSRAQWEQHKKAEKKQQKFEDMKQKQSEREEAMQRYKAKRKDKFLKFCKRTPKGQPQMKFQIKYLLGQLEQQHKERTKKSETPTT